MVYQISNIRDWNNILINNELVIADFFATWCGPCKIIVPKIIELENAYPNIKFIKVDVEDAEEISEFFKIRAMPTFISFKKGNIINKVEGADMDNIFNLILELIHKE